MSDSILLDDAIVIPRMDDLESFKTTTEKSISDILNGNSTVGKATKDSSGNTISSTYLKSADYNEDITQVNTNISTLQTTVGTLAPKKSPTFTGTPAAPTAAKGTNTTQIATTAFVTAEIADKIAASDAMIFKGTIGDTITTLPTTYKTGWTYRVVKAGTYADQVCEIGDLIIALVDRSGSGCVNADWCVAQTNIDGAVTSVTGDTKVSATKSGSGVTLKHAAVTKSATSTTATLSAGGTVTIVDGVTTDTTGHVTAVNTKTATLPAAYKHPAYTTKSSGLYKITVDSTGHISATNTVTASDLPSHTHSYAGSSSAGGSANSAKLIAVHASLPTTTTTYRIPYTVNTSTGNTALTMNGGFIYQLAPGTTSSDGSGRLITGNSTPSGTDGNLYGEFWLYSTNTGSWRISGNKSISYSMSLYLPSSSGCLTCVPTDGTAVGSASKPVYINSSGVATECTSINLNATTSDKVSVALTNPATGTTYNIPFNTYVSATDTRTICANNGITYYSLEGTTTTDGVAKVIIGNTSASGTVGNKYGGLRIYHTGQHYWDIDGTGTLSGNKTITLPDTGGCLLVNPTADTAIGDSRTPTYVDESGAIRVCEGYTLPSSAYCYDNDEVTAYPWHKIASATLTSAYQDANLVLLVNGTYYGTAATNQFADSGILKAKVRSGATVGSIDTSILFWTQASETLGNKLSDYRLVYTATSGTSVQVELWQKNDVRYGGYTFTVLSQSNRSGCESLLWTLTPPNRATAPTTGTGYVVSSLCNVANNASSASKVYATDANPVSTAMYYIPVLNGATDGNKQLMYDSTFKYFSIIGTTSSAGYTLISLGNAVSSGTDGNRYGSIRLFGSNAYYMTIDGNKAFTANRALKLPDSSGCLTCIPTNGTAVGSASKPVYISSVGVATECTSVDLNATSASSVYSSVISSASSQAYYMALQPSSATGNTAINNISAVKAYLTTGTTTSDGLTLLSLGNASTSGVDGNMYGGIRIYGKNASYWNITGSENPAKARTIKLSDNSGTIPLISTYGAAVGDATNPVYVAASGIITSCTDTAWVTATTSLSTFKLSAEVGTSTNVQMKKSLNVIEIRGTVVTLETYSSEVVVGTLGSGYRPSNIVIGQCYNTSNVAVYPLLVNSSGNVIMTSNAPSTYGGTTIFRIHAIFMID